MSLGCFSLSLAVKDLKISREFYEKLGFFVKAGSESDHFLVMKNGDCNIGLFQGMFEENIITLNPGWDQNGDDLAEFTDIRDIHQRLQDQGIETVHADISNPSGRAYMMLKDPDGNSILIDQHR